MRKQKTPCAILDITLLRSTKPCQALQPPKNPKAKKGLSGNNTIDEVIFDRKTFTFISDLIRKMIKAMVNCPIREKQNISTV